MSQIKPFKLIFEAHKIFESSLTFSQLNPSCLEIMTFLAFQIAEILENQINTTAPWQKV